LLLAITDAVATFFRALAKALAEHDESILLRRASLSLLFSGLVLIYLPNDMKESAKGTRKNHLCSIKGDLEESFYQIFIDNPNVGPPDI
jgi:hypothetical protein